MTRQYHRFELDGKRYTFEYDEGYTVERACGGKVKCRREYHEGVEEAECDMWYEDEIDKLDTGEWVALTLDVEMKCSGVRRQSEFDLPVGVEEIGHCKSCSGWVEDEDEDMCIGGIVIENSHEAAEKFVKEERS